MTSTPEIPGAEAAEGSVWGSEASAVSEVSSEDSGASEASEVSSEDADASEASEVSSEDADASEVGAASEPEAASEVGAALGVEAVDEGEAVHDATPAAALVPIDDAVARELALAALREITTTPTIGEFVDASVNADGVLTQRFSNRMQGYPNWFWTVSLAQLEGGEPSVLEVELLPGDGALLAPDWVPWAERLADYQAAQLALAAEGVLEGLDDDSDDDDDDEELDDVDDLDASDFDNDGSPILHSGDVDGVDIDELDDSDSDDDDESDDDDDSDDEDSDDEDSDDDSDDDDSDDDDSDDEIRDIDEDRSY